MILPKPSFEECLLAALEIVDNGDFTVARSLGQVGQELEDAYFGNQRSFRNIEGIWAGIQLMEMAKIIKLDCFAVAFVN